MTSKAPASRATALNRKRKASGQRRIDLLNLPSKYNYTIQPVRSTEITGDQR